MRDYCEYITDLLCLSFLLTFFPSSSVGPLHRLQFLFMVASSCQENVLQCGLSRATVPVSRTCYSTGAISVRTTCYSVGSPGPEFLLGEPAPAWAVQGHSSCQENMLQYGLSIGCSSCKENLLQHGLSMATVPVRKTCPKSC